MDRKTEPDAPGNRAGPRPGWPLPGIAAARRLDERPPMAAGDVLYYFPLKMRIAEWHRDRNKGIALAGSGPCWRS